MRSTRSMDTALNRAVEFLGAVVERNGKRGQRKVTLNRLDGYEPVTYEGKPAEVLYQVLYAATTSEEYGGYGYDLETLSDTIKLARVPQRGMGGHQTNLFHALTGHSRN